MGKGATTLGIIGVILGAGGLGFGFLAWTNQIVIQQTLNQQNIWYDSSDIYFSPPDSIYIPIPSIALIIDLNTPVSLHLLFTCIVGTYPDAVSYSDFFFYFAIDSVRLTNPWARVGPFEESSATGRYSATLQHFIGEMASGIYNFSVFIYSELAGNYVREPTFCIRSYPI